MDARIGRPTAQPAKAARLEAVACLRDRCRRHVPHHHRHPHSLLTPYDSSGAIRVDLSRVRFRPMTDLATKLLSDGDHLDILRRYLADAAVDLVSLDPPFNSNRDDNVIFRDESGNER
jgi:hypothetical protein